MEQRPRPLVVVILAAGQGKRMCSATPKAFHSLGGRPLFHYAVDAACALHPDHLVYVVPPQSQGIECADVPSTIVVQDPPQGTGHAVQFALENLPPLPESPDVLVLLGDLPLITTDLLMKLVDHGRHNPKAAGVVVGFKPPSDAVGYARFMLDAQSNLKEIIEFQDASTDVLNRTNLCNAGLMWLNGTHGVPLLADLTRCNAAKEYYLTEAAALAYQAQRPFALIEGEANTLKGVNTRQDLAACEAMLQERWRQKALNQGAALIDPQTVYFSFDTQVAPDVTIHPHVILGPGVVLEAGAVLGPFCVLENTHVGPSVRVGPFAHLRCGTILKEGSQVGNFVETKNTTFFEGSKAKHLSYVGDSSIGPQANLGAGTITCNYDGKQKHRTVIEKQAFVGANATLVAPVSIGEGAVVAAGSTITKDVAPHTLAFGRSRQCDVPYPPKEKS